MGFFKILWIGFVAGIGLNIAGFLFGAVSTLAAQAIRSFKARKAGAAK